MIGSSTSGYLTNIPRARMGYESWWRSCRNPVPLVSHIWRWKENGNLVIDFPMVRHNLRHNSPQTPPHPHPRVLYDSTWNLTTQTAEPKLNVTGACPASPEVVMQGCYGSMQKDMRRVSRPRGVAFRFSTFVPIRVPAISDFSCCLSCLLCLGQCRT